MSAGIIPVQGRLVEVRRRHFVVVDVCRSGLTQRLFATTRNGAQHLIRLRSLEDEGEGEELQIIWEIEPGARVIEGMNLPAPTGFDDPETLDAFLDAMRWGASVGANVDALQAPFRSGVDIEDYQLDPLVRALKMPRVNLLIADDVGLGKTIEAGLTVQELIIRRPFRVRRSLNSAP